MGRDEDRKRFQSQQLHASIDRSLRGTVNPPMDRFGVRLKLGDLVLYTPTYPTLFQVSEIAPVLDPSSPPGTVQLILSGVMPLVLNPNQPCISVVHVESPEGAEQAIKRHHAGRAVSEGNGNGPAPSGIEIVREDEGSGTGAAGAVGVIMGTGEPGANAEGGGSVHRDPGAEGDSPSDSQGDRPGPSQGDSDGDGPGSQDGPESEPEPEPEPGPGDDIQGHSSGGVGSAASGVGSSTAGRVDKDSE